MILGGGITTSYSDSSGRFSPALAELLALELINKGKDIKASKVFSNGGKCEIGKFFSVSCLQARKTTLV
jgi:hypothetical protein